LQLAFEGSDELPQAHARTEAHIGAATRTQQLAYEVEYDNRLALAKIVGRMHHAATVHRQGRADKTWKPAQQAPNSAARAHQVSRDSKLFLAAQQPGGADILKELRRQSVLAAAVRNDRLRVLQRGFQL
jgi:hypothetical protein